MTAPNITIVESDGLFTFSGIMSISDGNLVQSVQQLVDGSPNSIELLLSTSEGALTGKWLLPSCLDDDSVKISLYGEVELYHLVLEHEDDDSNYGILANGKKWVESCSKNDFIQFSQMEEINF